MPGYGGGSAVSNPGLTTSNPSATVDNSAYGGTGGDGGAGLLSSILNSAGTIGGAVIGANQQNQARQQQLQLATLNAQTQAKTFPMIAIVVVAGVVLFLLSR